MIRTKLDKNQKWLTIKIPMQPPKLSKSGKNFVVATSNGVRSDEATYNGQAIRAVASAWVRNDKPEERHTGTRGRQEKSSNGRRPL